MSDWGWHKFKLPEGTDPYKYKGNEWDTQGRMVRYDVHSENERPLYQWMRVNPQRINLGRLGFILKKKDGSVISLSELSDPAQHLNLWTGVAVSTFTIEGKKVTVTTIGHPEKDVITVKVNAPELNDGRILLNLRLPYASGKEFGNGADFNSVDKHQTTAKINNNNALFERQLDSTNFNIRLLWKGGGKIEQLAKHLPRETVGQYLGEAE
ncbi:MAG: hypothetical protein EOO89_28370, partial [Pedobacter sp.]